MAEPMAMAPIQALWHFNCRLHLDHAGVSFALYMRETTPLHA